MQKQMIKNNFLSDCIPSTKAKQLSIVCALILFIFIIYIVLTFPFIHYSISGISTDGQSVDGTFILQPTFGAIHISTIDIDPEWNMMRLKPSANDPLLFTFDNLGETHLVVSYRLLGLNRHYKLILHTESPPLVQPNIITHVFQTNEFGYLIKNKTS